MTALQAAKDRWATTQDPRLEKSPAWQLHPSAGAGREAHPIGSKGAQLCEPQKQ